jgi:hypothetical protein
MVGGNVQSIEETQTGNTRARAINKSTKAETTDEKTLTCGQESISVLRPGPAYVNSVNLADACARTVMK